MFRFALRKTETTRVIACLQLKIRAFACPGPNQFNKPA